MSLLEELHWEEWKEKVKGGVYIRVELNNVVQNSVGLMVSRRNTS